MFLDLFQKEHINMQKFITPFELDNLLQENKYHSKSIDGIFFNPINESFRISRNTDINYFFHAAR